MNVNGFVYDVSVRAEFTRAEADFLTKRALAHYDARCRGAAIPGRGAFLNGLRNKLGEDLDSTEIYLTTNDLDLLGKIIEPWQPDDAEEAARLYREVRRAFLAAVARRVELNEEKSS